MNQAMGHYLQGCANVAMARTPQQALAALYEAQAVLVRHPMASFVESRDSGASRAPDAHTPRNRATKS